MPSKMMPSKIFAAPAAVIARMSAPEKTETKDGFIVAVSPQAARRQLHVSLGLMGVMAAGVAALIAVNGLPAQSLFSSPAHNAHVTRVVVQPTFVRPATAARAPDAQEQFEQEQFGQERS